MNPPPFSLGSLSKRSDFGFSAPIFRIQHSCIAELTHRELTYTQPKSSDARERGKSILCLVENHFEVAHQARGEHSSIRTHSRYARSVSPFCWSPYDRGSSALSHRIRERNETFTEVKCIHLVYTHINHHPHPASFSWKNKPLRRSNSRAGSD